MKTVFICGKYKSRTFLGHCINIYKARQVAKKYWRLGYDVICPHSNSGFMHRCNSEQHFYKAYLKMIKDIDTMIMLKDWQQSGGSIKEHIRAIELGKEIVYE